MKSRDKEKINTNQESQEQSISGKSLGSENIPILAELAAKSPARLK